MDLVQVYIEKRTAELKSILRLYDLAGKGYPTELLSRVNELERLESKLREYRDVQEADA